MTTTVDDSSGGFAWYGSSWEYKYTGHTDDIDQAKYYNQTFHGSTGDGDYALFYWTGLDISIFGARRDNHGIYGVSVDNGPTSYYSGYDGNDTFQQVLFATADMPQGDHTIKLSNENSRNTAQYPTYIWFDIDYAVFTGTMLDPSAVSTSAATSASSTPLQATTSLSVATSSAYVVMPSTSSSLSTSGTLGSASTGPLASSMMSMPTSMAQSTSSLATLSGAVTAAPSGSGSVSGGIGAAQFNTMQTTGTPILAGNAGTSSGTVSPEGDHASSSTSNETTAVAVSVTVIVVAAVVIATVAGIWWFRKRKRQREAEAYDGLYMRQPDW